MSEPVVQNNAVPRHAKRITKASETEAQYAHLVGKVFIDEVHGKKRAFMTVKVDFVTNGDIVNELCAFYCDVAESRDNSYTIDDADIKTLCEWSLASEVEAWCASGSFMLSDN